MDCYRHGNIKLLGHFVTIIFGDKGEVGAFGSSDPTAHRFREVKRVDLSILPVIKC